MSTLPLNDVTEVEKLFSQVYTLFQQRVTLCNFELKRSTDESALNIPSKDEMLCRLQNALNCDALNHEEFILHCEDVAEKIVSAIRRWEQETFEVNCTEIWPFDVCITDIHSMIEKCQGLLQFKKSDESIIVEHTLLVEWWEPVEK